jgi:putative sigma-54 modulation protein
MIVQYRAKDINLSDANKAHIEAAVERFEKYSLDITRVMCNVMAEKEGVSVEFEIHIAHTSPVIINESDKELDTAIDIAIDRASKALRRLHDKVTDHKGPSIKELEVEDA